jgi:aldose 1-epimerase
VSPQGETTIAAAASPTVLDLRAGPLRLSLRPDLGGAIAGLWLNDLPVLRSTEGAALATSRLGGCYPLAPYSNRIGFRRFRWAGVEHTTQPNFDDNPHSVHGVAWQRPWQVLHSSATDAELQLTHTPDAHWPFAFDLRQRFVLTPDALEVQLSITNRHSDTQPVGLGWHPYFHKRAQSRLQIDVAGRWDSDATGLPEARVPQPGIHGAVAALDFDNCFDGWQGAAHIADEALAMTLTSSLPDLVVFTPTTKPYYCVEPVSHVSNAIQMADPLAHGLRALAPGERFDAWMKLEVAPA